MNAQNQYQPKGGMCVTCKKLFNNCSKLHFENMPVISTTADGQVIVRCTAHLRFNEIIQGDERSEAPAGMEC